MKTLLIILFAITAAKVSAQDYKKMYRNYTDSMMMKHFQRDTIAKNRYIDSMAKYKKLAIMTGKQ